MSASSMPTVAPSVASASARFTAVVLLPTPPLPEATAMMFLMPGTSFTPRCTECETTLETTFALTCATPGSFETRSTTCARTFSSTPRAG
jgi:hypothetical protein